MQNPKPHTDASDSFDCFPVRTHHCASTPASSSRVTEVPAPENYEATDTGSIPAPAYNRRDAQRPSEKHPTGDGFEEGDQGEYRAPAHNWELRGTASCAASACSRAEHTSQRPDGEETQQDGAAVVYFIFGCVVWVCPLSVLRRPTKNRLLQTNSRIRQ